MPSMTLLRDVRVTPPAADPQYIDLLSAERVIPASSERMFCTYLTYDGSDTAINDLQAIQGKFGHHAILLAAKEPKPAGTVEDCSDPKDMAKFDVFAVFADRLPDGHATHLPAGKNLVFQSHYVNTSEDELLVQDVVRLHQVPVAGVTVWGSAWANAPLEFNIAAHSSGSVVAECTVPSDMNVLMLGGHMHQYGSTFETLTGPDSNSLTSIYKIDPWKPEYRDEPPVQLDLSAPIHWTQGMVIRTKCSWNNTTDHMISFPEEMCSTFGYADGIDGWSCSAKLISN
jgi:hypothetical protein